MKRHIAPVLVIGFIIALGWTFMDRQPRQKRAVEKSEPAMPSAAISAPSSPDPAPALSQATEVQSNTFAALISAGKLEKQEARMFEAQTWEPELRKSLDLGPTVPLRRVSEVYEVAEFPYHHIRVDRVYRTDRPQQVVDMAAKDEDKVASAEKSRISPPGELLWETAMVADHVMVQTEAGVTRERLQRALPARTRIRDQITQSGLYLVEVPAEGERSLERAVLALSQLKDVVKFAEPDFLMSGADTTPNDPLYAGAPGPQWHLPKIMAPRAWDVIKEPKTPADAETTVVAVVDTGVDYTHPDLSLNLWTNPNEIAGNNLDDDENGKIDDVRGWDFIGQSSVQSTIIQDNDPMDDSGHGTHVAGIIGAVGNNAQGVSGVCWGVKILPLRIIKKVGTGTYGTYSSAVGALDYLKTLNRNGRQVAVANHSWGGTGFSQAMLNAINNPVAAPDPLPAGIKSTFAKDANQLTLTGTEQAKIRSGMTITGTGIPKGTLVTIVSGNSVTLSNYTTAARTSQALAFSNPVRPKPYGVLHVAAAGNSRFNNDRLPTYPASIPSGFVLSVGASDENDAVAHWQGLAGSNFGRLTVDLFAPGSAVWSVKWKQPAELDYGYESRDGTSMAAPQVAGAVALLRMWQPALTESQARQIVIDQVDVVPALAGKCISGGRLNLARMVDKLYQPILTGSGGSSSGGSLSTKALTAGLGVTGRAAKGEEHTLVIQEGSVWAWGSNGYGQLGPNGPAFDTFMNAETTAASATPLIVPSLESVAMVAAAWRTSFALKADGSVWAWGDAHLFGLPRADHDVPPQPVPQQVMGLWDAANPGPQAVWISASAGGGGGHVLVANEDGSLWAWGDNSNGQLGDGTEESDDTPVKVHNLDQVIMAAAGGEHSLALKSDGTVWEWGIGYGPPEVPSSSTPRQVAGLGRIVFIAAGVHTAYAIDEDGDVWWWGEFQGAANRGNYPAETATPLRYAELSGCVSVAVGRGFALALDAEGRVWSWGENRSGALGIGLEGLVSSAPQVVTIPADDGVSAIAVADDSCSITLGSGQILSWGSNRFGELGSGGQDASFLPIPIPRLQNITFVSSGNTPFARRSDGTWFTWSDYATPRSSFPRPFLDFAPMIEIQMSADVYSDAFFVAMKPDRTLWAWGYSSDDGRFGNASATNNQSILPKKALPVQDLGPVLDYSISSDNVGLHGLAVLPNGTVKAWGYNNYGQLGDGTTISRRKPVLVKGLTNVVEVSAGSAYSFARRADGTVWAWGANWFGQFADGTTTDRSLPAPIPGLTRIVKMSAPLAMAVRDDGTVWDWGDLEGGPPVQLTGLPLIKDIAKMDDVAYALAADGQIWAWQYGPVEDDPRFLGRLPDSIVDVRVPAPVVGLSDVVAIGSGPQCTYALKRDGSVWTWGENTLSGLGNGSGFSAVPIQVLGLGGSSTTQATLGTGAVVDSWILQNFTPEELLDDALIEDTADPDGDGMENLLEYALGQNPRIAGTGQPVGRIDLIGNAAQSLGLFSVPSVELIAGEHYLAFSVQRLGAIRQDIEYIIEVSTDLIQWQSGDPHTVTILDTAETLEAYSATSLEDVAVQYLRLRVRRKSDTPNSGVTSAVIAVDLSQVPQLRFSRARSRSLEGAGAAALGLTIFPASASAMIVPLTVTGTATPGSDFTTIKSITIPAGQTSVSLPVALLQDLKLEAEETVLFTLGKPPGLATLGLPAQHQLTIVDDEMAPGIFPQAGSRLVGSGDNLTFASTPVGSPVPALQWLKNGRIIPGANAAELELKHVQLQDAGAFTLKASNAVGSFTSSAADLAVVETATSSQTIPNGREAVLSARFSGAGLAFQWRKDGTALSDLTRYAGMDSPTLRIKKADAALDSGTYTCRVSKDGASVVSGDIRLSVLSEAPLFTSSVVIQLPSVVVGARYGPVPLYAYLNPAPNRTPTSWSVTGLPKGLRLDVKTGEISGIATEVKTASLTLKATNLEGTATAFANLTVHPLPDGSAGSWIGLLARRAEVNGNLGGRLDLTVSTAGSFSGKLLNGTSSHSFSGTLTTPVASLFPSGTATIKRPRPPDLAFSFVIDSSTNRLQNAQISDGDNTAAISGWRNVWSEAVPPPPGYLGAAHTLAIEPPADASLPQGYGFASFTMKPAGTLTVMGRLADGLDFTTAGFLGPNGEVLITQTSATADSVGGMLLVAPGTGPLFVDTTISGTLTWSRMKQAATSRVYRDGFVPTSVSVFGGRYLVPASTKVVMNLEDRSDNARLSFTGANIGAPPPLPDLLVQIKPGGGVLRPTNNPRNTTLVIKPSTGELSGAFSLEDPSPLIPMTIVTRKVTYQGQIVTRDGNASGYGHFLLAELPSLGPPKTTPLNSPMLSGSMRLEKSPASAP